MSTPTYTYAATVNTSGYLPYDGAAFFPTAAEAWEYLAEEREEALASLEDAGPDLTCHALRDGRSNARRRDDGDPANAGVVRGRTPGYTGDHDLGTTYEVTRIEGVVCADCGETFPDTDAGSEHWLAQHLEANTL